MAEAQQCLVYADAADAVAICSNVVGATVSERSSAGWHVGAWITDG